MVDAANYLTTNYSDHNTTVKIDNEKIIGADKITGKLEIKDYPNLEEIELEDNEITEVIIINCPKLKKVALHKNRMVKIDFTKITTSDNTSSGSAVNNYSLEELYLGENKIVDIDFLIVKE